MILLPFLTFFLGFLLCPRLVPAPPSAPALLNLDDEEDDEDEEEAAMLGRKGEAALMLEAEAGGEGRLFEKDDVTAADGDEEAMASDRRPGLGEGSCVDRGDGGGSSSA